MLLLVSLVPLIVGIGLVVVGVTNPGVQDCGSPVMFVLADRGNERVGLVGVEVTPEQRALEAQPRCTTLVRDRLVTAGIVGGAFVALATIGAVLGLIDDRMRLHHEPRFETYLRDTESD